jgi:hypothetical protein
MTKNDLIVENWNLKHPTTIRVRFWTGAREAKGRIGNTFSPAQLLSGHTPVVYVRDLEGKNWGAIALTHVEPVGQALA